ncbi:MAG: hypothetical protein JWP46_2645 [Modestobacter sp.]|nr:hypothetical protein [Modestobacter sp.]
MLGGDSTEGEYHRHGVQFLHGIELGRDDLR